MKDRPAILEVIEEVIQEVRTFRDSVRQNGQRGACYEVAHFVWAKFHLPMFEGVYQARNGNPINIHRWNLLPGGEIFDGTADQFGEGLDISVLKADHPSHCRYRPIWTRAFNPRTIDWLSHIAWTGQTDEEFWASNPDLEPRAGWWLEDVTLYVKWRSEMEARFASFREKPVPESVRSRTKIPPI